MIYEGKEIEQILPQKRPFVFVDRVLELESGKSIVAEFDMDPSLPFFAGHFPGDPIMPGALELEALAQTSGLIAALSPNIEKGKKYYLASANVKYTGVARAGGVLTMKSALLRSFGGLMQFEVEAACGRVVTVRGKIVLSEGVSERR